MAPESVILVFPKIEVDDLLIPWERCLGVEPGAVDPSVVAAMGEKDYDFAPVFQSPKPKQTVAGLISRERLQDLAVSNQPLALDEKGIIRPEIKDREDLDVLLDLMASTSAAIVVSEGADGPASLGLLTRSDLNKHHFRSIIYSFLANLEMRLASLVEETFEDHWDWVSHLNEDKQARVIGYWELSKRRGVDVGPVGAATLTEMLTVIAKTDRLRSLFRYTSRKSFDEAVGRIPDLRNQIMHPVRPLITDASSAQRLKEDLGAIISLTERVKILRSR